MIAVLAIVPSFLLSAWAGPLLIRRLRALSLQQTAYEDAPMTHQGKSGTPTMGGVLFLIGVAVALVLKHDATSFGLAVLTIGCGVVGAIDDIAAIRRSRNRGLQAREKFAATIAVAVVFLLIAISGHALQLNRFVVPAISVPAAATIVIAFAAILSTTHAVNLTDGLDGLAAGSVIPPLLVLLWFAWRQGNLSVVCFDAALLGTIAGFLLYNRHPAKVFMGDTGALALGGALAGSAIVIGAPLMLFAIGVVFVAEALSVILQVVSFKTTGRRIFRMSPLHHHFELSGFTETQVTLGFWLASCLGSSLMLLAARP